MPFASVVIHFRKETVARVLGLLSLSLPKVQLLDISRKLAEIHKGITSEGLSPEPRHSSSSDRSMTQAISLLLLTWHMSTCG